MFTIIYSFIVQSIHITIWSVSAFNTFSNLNKNKLLIS